MKHTHVPAVTLAPAGHLPYAVQETTAHPAAVATDGAREHADAPVKAVTVRLTGGELEDDGSLLVSWSYLKGGQYDIEAAYDHRTISRKGAETRLRAELAKHGMQITRFLGGPADGAREHTEQQADFTELIAAIPAAVDQAMRKTLSSQYTPHKAAQIAAGLITRLADPTPHLTAAQVTPVLDKDLGAQWTAPIESAMRDLDDCHSTAENAVVPLFGARIVISDWKSLAPVKTEGGMFGPGEQVDGRFTDLWFSYGTTTGTVPRAQAREIVDEMRQFAARMEALCDRADELAADDFVAVAEGSAGGAR